MNHFVTIIGGTTYDHVVYLDEFPASPQTIHQAPFHEGIGSTGSGKALTLTKLGLPNALYSIVGDDVYGEHVRDHLSKEHVNFFLDIDPNGTERHINIMNKKGQRVSMFITQSSTSIDFNLREVEAMLSMATIVVLNIIAYCRNLIPLVRASRLPVWTDLHDYTENNSYHQDFIDASQYIHLSSDNLADYRKVMEHFVAIGKELVICTHGRAGASLLTKTGEWIEQDALNNITIVDSNGAGDSFFAGFLYAFLQQKSLSDCMKYGAVCGALAVTSHDLIPRDLSLPQVEQLVKNLNKNSSASFSS